MIKFAIEQAEMQHAREQEDEEMINAERMRALTSKVDDLGGLTSGQSHEPTRCNINAVLKLKDKFDVIL